MPARVVMVDDEEDLVWITSKQMARTRPEISFEGFLDPIEALERIKQAPPDVLISDVQMPAMNGIELLIAARRVVPTLPVIIITAFGTSEVRHEVMKRGSVEYLEKPFSFSALLEVVDRILAARTGFSGSISLPMLPDLVQIYALSASSGALRIDRGGETGAIWFDRGQVVHAEKGELLGEEAFYSLIGWQGGRFWLEKGAVPPGRTITDAWQTLLIEGCRRLDEAAAKDVPAAEPAIQDWAVISRLLRESLNGAQVLDVPLDGSSPLSEAVKAVTAQAREIPAVTGRAVLELSGTVNGMAVIWDEKSGAVVASDDISSRPSLTRFRSAIESGVRSLWP
ncbi:MAG: response regulator [Thermoanaerobaculia bacterium]|nr:response regulator [Thermoanaerobaculia bacterium]